MTFQPGKEQPAVLVLEDGSSFSGFSFGADCETSGEVVFNTGMVGYPESFTDPSYCGQILALTYPLIGNYGVPAFSPEPLQDRFESDKIHLKALVVSEYSEDYHHWQATMNLSAWLKEQGIPALYGIDTRALTKKLRVQGSMRGKIVPHSMASSASSIPQSPRPETIECGSQHPVSQVSVKEPVTYGTGKKRVAVVDCGCKHTIMHSLVNRGVTVIRVPWNYDVTSLDVDGVLFSNGPGDPLAVTETVSTAKKVLDLGLPTFGICLGNQVLALATGAKTFKLKFGHRSQNQPCRMIGTQRCFITSQNHGYAVDISTLAPDWEPWFENVNDGTNEGLRHKTKPFMSVQFHPEAMPGPVDTAFLFDEFVRMLK